MFVLEVLPISKGLRKGSLTYISREPVAVGATVIVPIRNRETPAIVIKRTPASEAKMDIKRADFSLKSVSSTSSLRLADPSIISAALKTAAQHLVPPAQILGTILPTFHVDNILDGIYSPCFTRPEQQPGTTTRPDETLLQLPWDERIQYCRTYVRRLFSDKKSLVIVVPTLAHLDRWADALVSGAGDHMYTLNSGDSTKELEQKIAALHHEDHPVILITTPLYLYAIPTNTHTVIFEQVHNPNYSRRHGVAFDFGTYIQAFCQDAGIKLIYSGSVTDLRLVHRWRNNLIATETEPAFRIQQPAHNQVIDFQKIAAEREQAGARTPILTAAADAAVVKTLGAGRSVFLFCPRTGEAPITICRDCQQILRCPTCNHAVTRHMDPGRARYRYSCHHCNRAHEAEHTCSSCGGHTFWYQGIGTETVAEYVHKQYGSNYPLHILDGEHQTTSLQLHKAVTDIDPNAPAFVIGTIKALPLLPRFVTSIIVSLDALAVHPDPNIYTEITSIITLVSEKTSQLLLAQHRSLPVQLIHLIERGSLLPWYEYELATRSELGLPPFRQELHISWKNSQGTPEEHLGYLAKLFGTESVFPAPTPSTVAAGTVLVTIAPETWLEYLQKPASRLGKILATLERYYTIRVPRGMLAPLQ